MILQFIPSFSELSASTRKTVAQMYKYYLVHTADGIIILGEENNNIPRHRKLNIYNNFVLRCHDSMR